MNAALTAELAYDRIDRPNGTTLADIQTDIIGLQVIASGLVELVKLAERQSPSSEAVNAVRWSPLATALAMFDTLADDLGLSREAAELVREYIRELV